MRTKWILLTVFLLVLAAVFPYKQAYSETDHEITVTTEVVNVRDGAGLSFPVVQKIMRGEHYPIVNEKDDWIEIKLSGTKTGWVANWLVEKKSVVNAEAGLGTITGKSVRVRTGPGTNFQIVGSLNQGTAVSIIMEENENWVQIKMENIEGWVSAEYVQLPKSDSKNEEKIPKKTKSTNATITVESLNVRDQPSTNGAVLAKLAKNSIVTIHNEENEWLEITFQGIHGWVSKQYIQKGNSLTNNATAKILATALSVHKSASLKSKVIDEVKQNETYPILKEKGYIVQIELDSSKKGWVASWFVEKEGEAHASSPKNKVTDGKISILHDGTVIRNKSNAESVIIKQTKEGDVLSVVGLENNWYRVKLKDGKTGYVAGWMVHFDGNNEQITRTGVEKYLTDKVIVIDPGHGGRDSGTIGLRGTLEKNLTSRTAELLRDKLQAAGATVLLTRNTDTYVPLTSRVSISHIHNADAFISLHYDSTKNLGTSGITTYYYHWYQESLASSLSYSLASALQVENRGYRIGDYHVIRENKRAAVLVELGYLSNPADELSITTNDYQETVTTAIYNGLARYFK